MLTYLCTCAHFSSPSGEQLDYQPTLFVVNFSKCTTMTVDLVVISVTDLFYAEVVRRVDLGALEAVH